MRCPDRAKWIRSIVLRIDNLNDDEMGMEDFPPLEILDLILRTVHNLEELTIEQSLGGQTYFSASHCLSKANFPFHLRKFSTNIPSEDIFPFLASQPGILEYTTRATYTRLPFLPGSSMWPVTILPHLRCITSSAMFDVLRFVPHRPVHNIEIGTVIDTEPPQHIEYLEPTMALSTVPITHLQLHLNNNGLHLAASLTHLQHRLVQLRELTVPLSYKWISMENDLQDLGDIISSFPGLESITFVINSQGVGWPVHWKISWIFQCSIAHRCDALHRLEFDDVSDVDGQQSVVFNRDSPNARWIKESGDSSDLGHHIMYVVPYAASNILPMDFLYRVAEATGESLVPDFEVDEEGNLI